jgi:hypothetical protein
MSLPPDFWRLGRKLPWEEEAMRFQLCPALAIHQRESATNKHVPRSQNNKVQLQVCTIEEKQAPWLGSESKRGEENMRMG